MDTKYKGLFKNMLIKAGVSLLQKPFQNCIHGSRSKRRAPESCMMQCFVFKPLTPECNAIHVLTTMLAAASAPRMQVPPRGPRAAHQPSGELPEASTALRNPGEAALPSRFLQKHKEGFPSPGGLSFSPGGWLLSCGANMLPCYGQHSGG